MNYFQLFNLPQAFDIDIEKLLFQFYELQKKYHPDANYNSIKPENNNILEKSIYINKAYQILKNPYKRAKYLLSLNLFHFKEEKNNLSDELFLNKQLKIYEQLEILKHHPERKSELNQLFDKIKYKKNYYLLKLELMFNKKKWKLAAITLYKLLFYKKFKKVLKELIKKNKY
ncbi:Fe-S protein assembly co-chaperone HscB [Buchnera aphidicola]|nr:Fe-S protein assembly co-chaperone HscB [Buchnera aphidicola]